MTKKRLDKKIPVLETSFKEILVCKPKNARPYMEVFVYEPENVFLENLGTLFGILEINDDSPDSSYVVNYLISVIKKEFFSNVKRGTIESFEMALHKANLALSKLAEHEHISWIGKINAICAVAEKNNIHLTSTGTASALLLRSKALVNISEGGEDEDPNPLKTFQEVVSGRLEDGDKIIITTREIFNIFSLEEIKRSALKFSREDFFRFLNTALVNEMEKATVLIADISEKQEPEPASSKRSQKINAFSQSAFIDKNKKREDLSQRDEEKNILMDELKRELEKTKEGYTDEKTGHIYIKDDGMPGEKPSAFKDYSKDILGRMKNISKDSLGKIAGSPKTRRLVQEEKISFSQAEEKEESYPPISVSEPKEEILSKIWPKVKMFSKSFGALLVIFGTKTVSFLKTASFYTGSFIVNRIYIPLKKLVMFSISFIKSHLKKEKTESENVSHFDDYTQNPEMLSSTRQEKRDWFDALSNNNSSPSSISSPTTRDYYSESYDQPETSKKFLPSLEKIKGLFSRFSLKEKIISGLIVAVLIIVPYFIAKGIEKSKVQKTPAAIVEPVSVPLPLENDKNVTRMASVGNISSGNFGKIVDVNGKEFALKENSVFALEDQKEYAIPEEFQNPDLLFAMDDLNLIFLYKNGKITSISATSRKYQNNNISVSGGAKITSGASFLTYGYFLDSANNQIYRYPRAEGGFGEKISWIKDNADFSGAKDMAINENVYVTDGKNIFKFYRGKRQGFVIEETATPITIDQIFTKPESQNLYVLDKTNSRIIKLDANGSIINQYYSQEIGNSVSFSVSEESQKVYISGENGIGSFEMN